MNEGRFDLIDRTATLTQRVVMFCRQLPSTESNRIYVRQVIRSAGAIGTNYIEANEGLGRKDFLMRIRISRKEAKETIYWLQILLSINDQKYLDEGKYLIQEAGELKKILSAIILKMEAKQ